MLGTLVWVADGGSIEAGGAMASPCFKLEPPSIGAVEGGAGEVRVRSASEVDDLVPCTFLSFLLGVWEAPASALDPFRAVFFPLEEDTGPDCSEEVRPEDLAASLPVSLPFSCSFCFRACSSAACLNRACSFACSSICCFRTCQTLICGALGRAAFESAFALGADEVLVPSACLAAGTVEEDVDGPPFSSVDAGAAIDPELEAGFVPEESDTRGAAVCAPPKAC